MQQEVSSIVNVALVGNPNVGKSSLFNEFTGLKQKVSNFPGVTVEKKVGQIRLNQNLKANLIDLPGLYDLKAESEDEEIAVNYLKDPSNQLDIILLVADASNLKRNLILCTQIQKLGTPVILVLNMMDLAEKSKIAIDVSGLSKALGIPVIPMNARIGKGVNHLKDALVSAYLNPIKRKSKLIEEDSTIDLDLVNNLVREFEKSEIEWRNNKTVSDKIDNVLIHPIYGYLIFVAILLVVFQAVFSWAIYPMEWIETGFAVAGNWIFENLPPGSFTDLLVNGILAGLGGILVFIPQIALLFIFITVMEDTGYLTRVSFMLDKSLRRYGLNGKSVIPLLSGTACAVPAIMSARSINDRKERLITIFITPLMSCSARIPVYTLLIAMMTPEDAKLGIFNLQGILMLGLYLVGLFAAIISGFVLKYLIKSKKKASFIFEIPVYRMPQWKSVFINVYLKVRSFVYEAGKVIIAISIILWCLASYGPSENNDGSGMFSFAEKKTELPESYAGMLGKKIEPVIKPLGFDWKIGISLVTSFAAREVFVGTMATIYAVENAEDVKSIKESMMEARWPDTGERIYTTATICSLLIFYAFALQCMSTIAVVRKETGSWKWPLIQLAYLTSLAYLSSLLVYNILS